MLLIVAGLVLLYFGAEGLVRGSCALAARFGIPPLIIGLTIVAFGKSSPELLASLSAATKGANDVAIGNVVGSNIFNILCVLGVTASIVPLKVAGIGLRDAGFMLGFAILPLPFAFSQRSISRVEGPVFLGLHGVYLYFLWPA